MNIKIRYIFGALALGLVAWLYYGPIEVGAPNVSYGFPCEPLGRTPSGSRYALQDYPGRTSPGFFDSYMQKAYRNSSLSDDALKRIEAKTLDEWEQACTLARDNRKVQLEIVLVVSAVVFFAIPHNKAIRRKKGSPNGERSGRAT